MNETKNKTYTIKRRPLWLCCILSFLTFGVYLWIWFYKALNDSNKISEKKYKVLLLYIAALGTMISAISLLISGGVVLIVGSKFAYPLTLESVMEINKEAAVTSLILLILGCVCVFCMLIIVYVLIFFLSKNLEEKYIYYFVPLFLFGLIIPLIYAQSVINDYAGTYDENEKPKYLGLSTIPISH